MPETDNKVQAVVLLHGLGRGRASMKRLQEHLVRTDFWPLTWSYPSHEKIEVHAEAVHKDLLAMDEDPVIDTVHIVSHSLGAIVTRYALSLGVPDKIGRIVMMAPPNRGSPLADVFLPVIGEYAPSLEAMTKSPDSLANRLRIPEGIEVGIIAAESDGKVPVEDTHLPDEETDHVIVPGFHTFIMNRRDVHQHVVQFLRHGEFEKESGSG